MTIDLTRQQALRASTALMALAAAGWHTAAWAGCDNKTPAAGATVTCSPAAPNPDSGGILSANESTAPNNVAVGVQANSSVSGIYLGTGSAVTIASGGSVTGTSVGASRAIDLAGGTLSIAGSVTSPGAAAILLGTASGSRVTLLQGGTVTSNGGTGAIVANGAGATYVIDGAVVTNGTYFNPTGTGASVVSLGGTLTATLGATGTITTNGDRMIGLVGGGSGNNLTIAGQITASGANSAGVSTPNGTSTITVANGGSISATGATSNAIFNGGVGSTITIAGTVSASGNNSATIQSGADVTVNVLATGKVLAPGNNGEALYFTTGVVRVNVAAGAFVERSGTGGGESILFAPAAANGSVIDNFGTINASIGTAIDANGGGISIVNHTGALISGPSGIRTLGSTHGSSVLNEGGIVNGVDFSTGIANDTLEVRPGSFISGAVRGGGGTDSLVFGGVSGSDTFNLDLLNHNGTVLSGQRYSGFERYFKNGGATWTLTGTAGAGGSGLSFAVDAGTLVQNGAFTNAAFSVASGATLAGTGSVGDTTVSGTLSPGGDGVIGTLTVNGNLVFNAGSTLRADIGSTAGSSDRVNVTGTAALNGGVAAFASGSTFTAGRYTLLNAAGGVSGTFSPLTTTPSSPAILSYDANNVYLVVDASNNQTFSMSTRESITFTAPVVTTIRVNAFSTQVIGRLLGGTPLYDQTFSAAFADPAVQAGVTAARAAITTAGGPGVIIGAPTRVSSTVTSSTVMGSPTYSLTNTQSAVTSATTFGPATITIGALSTCGVSSLPSATRPTCTTGGTSTSVGDAIEHFDTLTTTVFTVAETRTDTITETLTETWELNGQVVAVGNVHAEVQSGLFDLGGRLLGRLGQIARGNHGWADGYAFRVTQGATREARGFAGGVGLALGEGLTLGLGIERGRIDIDVPGGRESGRVNLTEIGAVLRLDSGRFSGSLALVKGFGNAATARTIIGNSRADYDPRLTGAGLALGYAIETGGWTLRPEGGIDWVRVSADGFTESDRLGLVVGGAAARQVRATAGLGVLRDFGAFTLAARARYLAVLDGSQRRVTTAFALAPTRPLTMTAPGEPDGALLGARIAVPLGERATISLGYDGRFGGEYTAHSGNLGLAVTF